MPELPEVETVARELRELIGQQIVGVEVLWERTIAAPDPAGFVELLRGQRIGGVGRRGKWLVLSLEQGSTLLIHLRMSGRLQLQPVDAQIDRHARVLFTLEDGHRLCFTDMRKFGRMVLTTDPEEVLDDLGPEPLGKGFTIEWLKEALAGRRARLKTLLLDQRFLAGLGNIYADEALWRAQLHPLRPAHTLGAGEVARLHRAIQQVLRAAIDRRGTTLDDGGYVGTDGQPGGFAELLAVYGRKGQPCLRCGAYVVRMVVGGRGTHICPRCQEQ